VDAVANAIGVHPKSVRLVAGFKGRDKVIEVDDLDTATLDRLRGLESG
jgi:hypothetical protein